jgi:Fe-S-cluster containining protein
VAGQSHNPAGLAASWLAAIARHDIRAGLESIYSDAAAAITARGPVCWASGRCCNFEKHGHRLYVTGLEAAYCIDQLPVVAAKRPENFPESGLRLIVLESAQQTGGCPFQVRNLCGVHAIKPLGCRIYFCDQSAQQWQQDLSEQLLARLRALHDEHGIEYRYGEWRDMLRRFDIPAAA